MTFPTTDDDIRFLKTVILRELGTAPNPRAAIGDIAHRHKLTADDVKSLVAEPARIRAWAADNGIECNLHGRVPEAVVAQYRAATSRAGAA